MYKMIIVDDEENARELIAKCIEKTDCGFVVVAQFSDGKEALTYLEDNKVDLVVTDIKMPKMDGIELAKNIYEKMPSTAVVIFSGYEDFKYAKEAISYKVESYLVKPVVLKEFFQVLKKIKEDFDKSLRSDSRELKEEFLNDLSMGVIRDIGDYNKRFMQCEFPFSHEMSKGFIISVEMKDELFSEKWKHGKSGLKTALINLIEMNYSYCNVYHLCNKNNAFEFVYIGAGEKFDISLVEQIIKEELDISAEVKTDIKFQNLFEMSQLYFKTKTKYEKATFLISQIMTGNKKRAYNLFLELMQQEPTKSRQSLMKSISQIVGIDVSTLLKGTENDLKGIIVNIENNFSQDVVIKKAQQFLEKNYNKDITRDDVADYVYMNSSYFSRYFTEKTGMTFYDYLVDIRMRKAIELLKTHKKIGEIGIATGYNYQKYFIRNFKNYTGYTPTDYRKYVLKIEE